MKRLHGIALLTAALGVAACDDDPKPGPATDAAAPDAGDAATSASDGAAADTVPTASALTFHGDIAPIFNSKCVKCHQEGGIGPFRLDSYAEAVKKAAAIAANTKDGIMPPYLVTHDGTCGDFDDSETLTASEKTKIWDWATGDKKEGTSVTLTPPARPGIEASKEYKTPMLAPVAQGGALAEFDEYRCFALDSDLTKDTFITGYDVIPGNPAVVHHVVMFLVDPAKMTSMGKTNGALMQELDAKDPDRQGWTCFGMAGEGIEVDSAPVVWAPGQGPVVYPNVGVRQKTGHKVVIQMHYNLADPRVKGMTDLTTVRLKHADQVPRQAIYLLKDAFLETLSKPQPDVLPAGNPSAKYTWKKTAAQMGLGQLPYVDLMGVMPHMHERGVKKEMSVTQPGGQKSCAAKVDRWDFHWQKMYMYKGTPTRLTAATELELTCEYDTSKDTKPVLPGWGTRNEMCIAILILALPPGVAL